MAKVIKVRAPDKTALSKMNEEEIRSLVKTRAGKLLDSLPAEILPVGVNAVSLSSNPRADVGVWAEWTRACSDQRTRIQDYVDPPEFEIQEESMRRPGGEAFNSGLVIRQLGQEK